MATEALTLPQSSNFNDLTPEIRSDVILSIQRLVRLAQFKESTLDEKKLSWEVIRFLRQEAGFRGSNTDIAKAISGLMPSVNVQVNVDSERQLLKHRAENGLTQLSRDRARQSLAKLDAAVGRPSTTIDASLGQTSNNIGQEPIQAAEKPDGERT